MVMIITALTVITTCPLGFSKLNMKTFSMMEMTLCSCIPNGTCIHLGSVNLWLPTKECCAEQQMKVFIGQKAT